MRCRSGHGSRSRPTTSTTAHVSATGHRLPASPFRLDHGAATNPFEDVLNSDLIVLWGSNVVEAHPLAGRRVMQAKKKGIPIIVIDPRYSATARLADDWLRFNPSTHIALANSMMYWIIKEGLEDKEFIEKRTKGFEDLKKMVEKYADVEKITGVPTEKVKELARKYAAAKNAVIIYCLGITEPPPVPTTSVRWPTCRCSAAT